MGWLMVGLSLLLALLMGELSLVGLVAAFGVDRPTPDRVTLALASTVLALSAVEAVINTLRIAVKEMTS